MDLEARSLQPNVRAVLLAKLREYKSDLNNVKTEVKRLSSGGNYLSARDDLLESGMADALTVILHLCSFFEDWTKYKHCCSLVYSVRFISSDSRMSKLDFSLVSAVGVILCLYCLFLAYAFILPLTLVINIVDIGISWSKIKADDVHWEIKSI